MDRESHQRAINHPVCLGGGGGSGLSHRGSRELQRVEGAAEDLGVLTELRRKQTIPHEPRAGGRGGRGGGRVGGGGGGR